MAKQPVRIAARAVILHQDRLLLVNAWPDGKSDLLCAPGGGVEPGASLPENLIREVYEETGLSIEVGRPCLINEFHDPRIGFHQVEIFFHGQLCGSSQVAEDWKDPEQVVSRRIWATREDLAALRVKPDTLADIAFSQNRTLMYDPLERIVM